ncbi:MAG TPA: MerR family transcriptional regulator [Candidatus Polarisedimenticolia bacterium]|nr:MerR family transcriptional regulator [Candidatus Polarisedimenticolia bacterium]
MAEAIPRKLFYKLQEVCELTDTQPYVLRFWESEFTQLAPTKSRNGQRLYRKRDIDLVLEIKRLLNDEGQTIAAAREKLGMGEGPAPFLEELFEPPPAAEPRAPAATAAPVKDTASREVADGLREILGLLDATDRRLSGGD